MPCCSLAPLPMRHDTRNVERMGSRVARLRERLNAEDDRRRRTAFQMLCAVGSAGLGLDHCADEAFRRVTARSVSSSAAVSPRSRAAVVAALSRNRLRLTRSH